MQSAILSPRPSLKNAPFIAFIEADYAHSGAQWL
jgi:hypothetical protein